MSKELGVYTAVEAEIDRRMAGTDSNRTLIKIYLAKLHEEKFSLF